MAGLKGQQRVPRTDPRIRRNSQNLANNFTAFAGAISLNTSGEIVLSIAANGGLVQTSGLAVNFGTGLQIVTNILKTKDSEINHNALLNYAADQHIAHSTVSISAGTGLSGGGNIAASRTLAVQLPYGSMYAYNVAQTITIVSTGTFVEIPGSFSEGSVSNFVFQNSKELKCSVAGKYLVNWSLGLSVPTGNQELEAAVMVNGTAVTRTAAHSQTNIGTGDAPVCLSGNGILTLAVNDLVSLAVAEITATDDIEMQHGNLALSYLGA